MLQMSYLTEIIGVLRRDNPNYSQSALAERVAQFDMARKAKKSANQQPAVGQSVRATRPVKRESLENAWGGKRGWNDPDRLILRSADESHLRIFPYIEQIIRVLYKDFGPKHVALRLIRRRFLTDAYDYKLYSPYSPDHRLYKLLDPFYFPEHSDLDFEQHARFVTILALNGDLQAYQHLSVVFDRTVSSDFFPDNMLRYLPMMAVITGLYGDYKHASDLCQLARDRHARGNLKPQDAKCIDYELQSNQADFNCQIREPSSIRGALEEPSRVLKNVLQHYRNSNSPHPKSIVRQALCCYCRCLIRTSLILRKNRNEFVIPDEFAAYLKMYIGLAEAYEQELQPDLESTVLFEGYHALGMDWDSISRACAVILPDLPDNTIRDVLGASSPNGAIAEALDFAWQAHERANHAFGIGDHLDREFLDNNRDCSPNIPTETIRCDVLSAYRRYITEGLLHYSYARVATSGAEFERRKALSVKSASDLEYTVGPERMKHSRGMLALLQTLTSHLESPTRTRNRGK